MDVYKHIGKRILSMLLLFALMMGNLTIPVYAQETNILYEADFEDKNAGDALDDWTPNRSGASVAVAEDNGNKIMRTSAADKVGTSVYFTRNIENQSSGKITLSFDFRAGQRSGSAGYVVLANGDTNLVQFQIHKKGTIVWNKGNGSLKTLLNSYNADQWYHVQIDADLDKKTADISIEGEKVISNESFNNQDLAGIDNIKTAVAIGSQNCSFDYDNFVLTKAEVIAPEEIILSADTAELQPGEIFQLNAQVNPEGAGGTVVWSSDHEEIASVSSSGLVTANGTGTANITASVEDYDSISAVCSVTVEEKELPWTEDFEAEKYVVGELPADWVHTGDEQVSFKIAEDEGSKVLSIDSNGKLANSAVSPFVQTKLPVMTEGRTLLSLDFYPYQSTGVGYIYLTDSLGETVLQINIGATGNIQVNNTGSPQNLTPYKVNEWQKLGLIFDMESGNIDLMYNGETVKYGIASIDKENVAYLKIGAGRGYATRYLVDNITVEEAPEIAPESIRLSLNELAMKRGEEVQLEYTAVPEQANGSKNIVYESDNEDVAAVTSDGTVTAKNQGTATVTVYDKEHPDIKDTCTVNVKAYSIDRIFYVSPDGNDDNDGSKGTPFQTIGQAVVEVQKWNSDMKGDIIIFLREGVYQQTETLELDQSISGTNGYSVIFKAYQDENVVVSGGIEITDWKPLDDGSGIYYATVGQDIETRQMYVNGEAATRARSESGLPDSTYDRCSSPEQEVGHTTTATEMAGWKNQSDIEMVYKQKWTNPRCPVEKITLSEDGTKAEIQMQQPAYYYCRNKMSTSTTNPWYIENAYELLDTPGEWYLDETGDIGKGKNTFYYMPKEGEDINQAEVIVPVLEELVNLNGTLEEPVRNVKFEGISFQHTTWLRPGTDRGYPDAQNNVLREYDPTLSISNHLCREYVPNGAVNFQHTENLEFNGCDFRNIGATALVGKNGCNNTVIRNNLFTKLSGGGIQLGEVDLYTEDYYNPSDERKLIRNTLIENNVITDIANEYRCSTGIGAAFPSNITISHNTIYDVPYSGMHIGWGWEKREVFATEDVKIIGNLIHDCMKELNDGGAIYTLGYTSNSSYRMNIIQGNYAYNQYNNYGLLYLDEGGDYYDASGNVFDTSANTGVRWLLHKHSTNKVHDNYVNSTLSRPDSQEENIYVEGDNWSEEAQAIMTEAGAKEVVEDTQAYGLEELLSQADEIQNEADYEEASWNTFVSEREEARTLLQSGSYTKTDIEEQWYELKAAMEGLEERPVSKTTLEYFLGQAKKYVEDGTVDGLVESIQKMFADAIAKGEAVMADEGATREEVLDAARDLMLAIHALDMKAADKTDLQMALELTELIDLTKYVEVGQAEYLAAKEAAEAVMADGDAMQEETDQAWNALIEAMEALRLKADKSVLQDLIDQVADLDLTGYTEESAAAFRAALAAANEVLADETLSTDEQEKVDDAVAALRDAYDGLEKAQSGSNEEIQDPGIGSEDRDTSGNGSGNTAGTSDNASADRAAKTGDHTGTGSAVAVMALSLLGIAVITMMRRQRR